MFLVLRIVILGFIARISIKRIAVNVKKRKVY
jgi:hypothetical protein